jgi:hypothetical protein
MALAVTPKAAQGEALGFPWLPQPPVLVHAFSKNIRAFLAGPWAVQVPIGGLPRVTAYIVELGEAPQARTLLHVYEERLDDTEASVCDECRCMGA